MNNAPLYIVTSGFIMEQMMNEDKLKLMSKLRGKLKCDNCMRNSTCACTGFFEDALKSGTMFYISQMLFDNFNSQRMIELIKDYPENIIISEYVEFRICEYYE